VEDFWKALAANKTGATTGTHRRYSDKTAKRSGLGAAQDREAVATRPDARRLARLINVTGTWLTR
jgi:hypothetical protein